MILFYIILTLLVILLLFWLSISIYVNWSNVKLFNPKVLCKKTVLAIFAHPDDEALSCSGTLSKLAKSANVVLVILTKGERGQAGMVLNNELKAIREKELLNSIKQIGISNVFQLDLGDGQLKKNKEIVLKEMRKIIRQANPDVVITHDMSGLYGHPDHITTSELVTQLQKENRYDIWYTTLPDKVLKLLNMKKLDDTKLDQQLPQSNIRVATFGQILMKIKIVNGYKSQRHSLTGSFPVKFIPWWFYVSLGTFEYFSVKKYD